MEGCGIAVLVLKLPLFYLILAAKHKSGDADSRYAREKPGSAFLLKSEGSDGRATGTECLLQGAVTVILFAVSYCCVPDLQVHLHHRCGCMENT